MLVSLLTWVVLYPIVNGEFRPEPKIVGGQYIDITDAPHSVALHIKCTEQDNYVKYWLCGSSVLNQRLLLTAGHCAGTCTPKSYIIAHVGDINKHNPNVHSALSYLLHEDYNAELIMNDIALITLTSSLRLNSRVSRVVIMKNPPYKGKATVAGWGFVDENRELSGDLLKAVEQSVWSTGDCKKTLKHKRKGVFCASSNSKKEFPSIGDSGSALVVMGYIQIGLVSFKKMKGGVTYYTDVGYYYDWIQKAARLSFCDTQNAAVLL